MRGNWIGLSVAIVVASFAFAWGVQSHRVPLPVKAPVVANPSPDRLMLYLNGVLLDRDNVFLSSRVGDRFELRPAVENRVMANYSNTWISVEVSGSTNTTSAPGWSPAGSAGFGHSATVLYSIHDRYVLAPMIVRTFPALSLVRKEAFGAFVELHSGTNSLVRSRVHFLFPTNYAETTVHLTGALAEKVMREQVDVLYSPNLLYCKE